MNRKNMRFYFIPMITEVSVAEDGINYEKIIPNSFHHDHEDYKCTVSVIPGVTKIKFTALPDGVKHYFWIYSDDNGNENVAIGDGNEMNVCFMTVPDYYNGDLTLYIEEAQTEVDFGNDTRNLYFKSETEVSIDIRSFSLMSEKIFIR